jgi:hypothetical protein
MPLITRLWAYLQPRISSGGIVLQALWLFAAFFAYLFAIFPAVGYEIVQRLDRGHRLSIPATWTAGVVLGFVLLAVVSAGTGGGRSRGLTDVAAGPTQAVATQLATLTPTSAPLATVQATAGPTLVPTVAPTAEPTLEPTPSPTPAPTFASFGDGIYAVGSEIAPGTYRLREPASFCYWSRLKGFGGTSDEIIANDVVSDAFAVVTIGTNDVGFESNDCGEWTKDLSPVTFSTSSIDFDGTYIVGKDIKSGTWRSTGGDFCYWARLSGFGGTSGSIIANDIVSSGKTIVTIRSTDKGFETKGCGTWSRS